MGSSYQSMGNYSKSLSIYYNALKNSINYNDSNNIISAKINIGLTYFYIGNNNLAIVYYNDALKDVKKLKLKQEQAAIQFNLSLVYSSEKKYNLALKNELSALKFYQQIKDDNKISIVLNGIGSIYFYLKEFNKSEYYFKNVLAIAKKYENFQILSIANNNLGNLFIKKREFTKSKIYFFEGLKYAKLIKSKDDLKDSYLGLSVCDSSQKMFESAYLNYKIFSNYKDSLKNEEEIKKQTKIEIKSEFEKKEAISKLEAHHKEALFQKEKKTHKIKLVFLSCIVLLVVFLSIYFYYNLRLNRKQKLLIQLKQKEITDNINYAQRIQAAILPSQNYWRKLLPKSFIFYRPKDIVSGDFYWLERFDDFILFAAADCTGHGVSGALVSVVCANALNQVAKEYKIIDPGKILDKTRELILEAFSKRGKDITDGMDISICTLNIKTNVLEWAGANNPLYYITSNFLHEIKGDKQPIGKFDNYKPFTTHKVHLKKGDNIYIFTDGYADQFGGNKGKKLMYKKLKEILLSIHQSPINEQKDIIRKTFENWKGNIEQTDDVLLIGIEIHENES